MENLRHLIICIFLSMKRSTEIQVESCHKRFKTYTIERMIVIESIHGLSPLEATRPYCLDAAGRSARKLSVPK